MLAKQIQPILKTGAKEHNNRLLTHLDTVSSCFAPGDLLIFSDLQDQKGPYKINDALDKLSAITAKQNPDFDLYHLQRRLKDAGSVFEYLQGGWALDKYKFLPMVQKAWYERPDKDWYVFFETDTYVFWNNMLEFLSHFEPEKALYLGSPVWPADGTVIFAHGGSGFVLSRAAMRRLNSDVPDEMLGGYEYGIKVSEWCCGDQVLAEVLKRKGINLRGYWPMFNGEKPSTLFFDDESWCQPILTFHHLASSEVTELWTEEKHWITGIEEYAEFPGTILTFEELFRDYVFTFLLREEEKINWNNHAGSREGVSELKVPADSIQKCRSLCEKQVTCLQYCFYESDRICDLSKSVRIGERLEVNEDGNRIISGWMLQRIAVWMKEKECSVIKWVRANP